MAHQDIQAAQVVGFPHEEDLGDSSARNLAVAQLNARAALARRSDNRRGAEMSDSDSDSLSVVAARLVDAACFARDGDREAAKVYIAHAVALLHEQPHTIPAITSPLERGGLEAVRSGLAAWQRRRLVAYIDTHLAGRIRSENLAALLSLSVGHFCRAFKSSFGLSAHEYLVRRRIEVAQGLMLTTSDPLGAIAFSCGMSDQSHFTRWFRRIVGETPHRWRRARRGALEDHVTELAYLAVNQVSDSGPHKNHLRRRRQDTEGTPVSPTARRTALIRVVKVESDTMHPPKPRR